MLGQGSGDARAQRAGIAGGRGDLCRRDLGFDLSRCEVALEVAGRSRGNVRAELGGSHRGAAGELQPFAFRLDIEAGPGRQACESPP